MLTAGGLTVASLAQSSPAQSDPDSLISPVVAQLPLSSLLSQPVIATGRVDGLLDLLLPVDVVAYAWPAVETQNSLPVGSEFALLPIARATTTLGAFELKVDPAAIPAAYKSSTGLVDIRLEAHALSGVATWETTVAEVAGQWSDPAAVETSIGSLLPLATQVLSLVSAPVGGELDVDDPDGFLEPWTECTMTVLARSNRSAKVADGLAEGDQTSQFTFRNSQSVTTQVAVNAGSGFKVGGSVTRSGSFGWESIAMKGKRGYYINNDIAKFRENCTTYSGGGAGTPLAPKIYWKSTGLSGGTGNTASTYSPTWSTCRNVAAGPWWRESSSGASFSAGTGFNLSDFIGFDIGSTQQWDTNGKLGYNTPTNTGYQVCGSDGASPGFASRVRGNKL